MSESRNTENAWAHAEQQIITCLRNMAKRPGAGTGNLGHLPAELRGIGDEVARTAEELRRQRRDLERNAFTDRLTGIANRAGYEREIDRLWALGEPFTCAYIDIDQLKRCNDDFGHEMGNRYIISTCRALVEFLEMGEQLYRMGGDEFIVLSRTASEQELERRLERCRATLVDATSDGGFPMVQSFSFGCSGVNPAAGDSRRQMTLDADRKMYFYKIQHRAERSQPKRSAVVRTGCMPVDERVFQALSMADENRYLFIINLDTDESHWSLNAVRDFGMPSEHPYRSVDLWLSRVHPDDRDNVESEVRAIIAGQWHFHTMQYRVLDAMGEYALCEVTGFRLDGADGEPNVYAGAIVNRSMAETTDAVTGLGDAHALVTAIGQARRTGNRTGFIIVKVCDLDKVNTRFGYDAGDRVLSETAGCIVDASRAKARVFRGHGVTFVAVFDEFSEEDMEGVKREIAESLGSPVLLGTFPYMPPIRVASAHYEIIDSQPATIIAELGRLVHEAPQTKGTELG